MTKDEQITELTEKFVSLTRKYAKMQTGYRGIILQELLDECKLIPLSVAKSGLFEADLRQI